MKKKVKIILFFGLIITLLIYFGIWLISKNTKTEKRETEIIVETLQINAAIPFKAGQKFEYEIRGYSQDGGIISQGQGIYTLKAINEKYYTLQIKGSIFVLRPSDYMFNFENIYYYNKTTGDLERVDFDGESYFGEKAELRAVDTSVIFANWMLALTDNFYYKKEGIYKKIKVVGKEKINDRETFKVEVETASSDRKMIIWVDVKKRIAIKEKKFIDGDAYERNLISEKFNGENND